MKATGREWTLRGLLLVPGVIHLLPLSGVMGAEALTRLYGLDFSASDLEILMRHRAVLFGLLGALLCTAAFKPSLRKLALLAGLASAVSFLLLAFSVGGYGEGVARIVTADWVALACLVGAAVLSQRRFNP